MSVEAYRQELISIKKELDRITSSPQFQNASYSYTGPAIYLQSAECPPPFAACDASVMDCPEDKYGQPEMYTVNGQRCYQSGALVRTALKQRQSTQTDTTDSVIGQIRELVKSASKLNTVLQTEAMKTKPERTLPGMVSNCEDVLPSFPAARHVVKTKSGIEVAFDIDTNTKDRLDFCEEYTDSEGKCIYNVQSKRCVRKTNAALRAVKKEIAEEEALIKDFENKLNTFLDEVQKSAFNADFDMLIASLSRLSTLEKPELETKFQELLPDIERFFKTIEKTPLFPLFNDVATRFQKLEMRRTLRREGKFELKFENFGVMDVLALVYDRLKEKSLSAVDRAIGFVKGKLGWRMKQNVEQIAVEEEKLNPDVKRATDTLIEKAVSNGKAAAFAGVLASFLTNFANQKGEDGKPTDLARKAEVYIQWCVEHGIFINVVGAGLVAGASIALLPASQLVPLLKAAAHMVSGMSNVQGVLLSGALNGIGSVWETNSAAEYASILKSLNEDTEQKGVTGGGDEEPGTQTTPNASVNWMSRYLSAFKEQAGRMFKPKQTEKAETAALQSSVADSAVFRVILNKTLLKNLSAGLMMTAVDYYLPGFALLTVVGAWSWILSDKQKREYLKELFNELKSKSQEILNKMTGTLTLGGVTFVSRESIVNATNTLTSAISSVAGAISDKARSAVNAAGAAFGTVKQWFTGTDALAPTIINIGPDTAKDGKFVVNVLVIADPDTQPTEALRMLDMHKNRVQFKRDQVFKFWQTNLNNFEETRHLVQRLQQKEGVVPILLHLKAGIVSDEETWRDEVDDLMTLFQQPSTESSTDAAVRRPNPQYVNMIMNENAAETWNKLFVALDEFLYEAAKPFEDACERDAVVADRLSESRIKVVLFTEKNQTCHNIRYDLMNAEISEVKKALSSPFIDIMVARFMNLDFRTEKQKTNVEVHDQYDHFIFQNYLLQKDALQRFGPVDFAIFVNSSTRDYISFTTYKERLQQISQPSTIQVFVLLNEDTRGDMPRVGNHLSRRFHIPIQHIFLGSFSEIQKEHVQNRPIATTSNSPPPESKLAKPKRNAPRKDTYSKQQVQEEYTRRAKKLQDWIIRAANGKITKLKETIDHVDTVDPMASQRFMYKYPIVKKGLDVRDASE